MSHQVRISLPCHFKTFYFPRFQLEALRLQDFLRSLPLVHRRVCAKLRLDLGLGRGLHGHLAHLRLPPLLLHEAR